MWTPTFPRHSTADACGDCVLQAEADHRIANHLALLTSYLRLQSADLAKQTTSPTHESVRLLMANLDAQITAVSRLHRSLAANGRRAPTDLGVQLHEVCAPFIAGLSGGTRLVEDLKAGCIVRPEHVLPLTQIVAEVITNAIKHTHAAGEPGAITVHCGRVDGGALLVEVADNGCGLPEGFDPATDGGLGFRLLRALGRQIGATFTFASSRQGTNFRLTLPSASQTA